MSSNHVPLDHVDTSNSLSRPADVVVHKELQISNDNALKRDRHFQLVQNSYLLTRMGSFRSLVCAALAVRNESLQTSQSHSRQNLYVFT